MHPIPAFNPSLFLFRSLSILPPRPSLPRAPQASLASYSYSFQNRDTSLSRPQTLRYPLLLPSSIPPRRPIHLLAADLDGTLLNPSNYVDVANIEAIISLIQSGVIFVPATGKSRVGAMRAMGRLGSLLKRRGKGQCPGIFLNGLMVYGRDGQIVYEKRLKVHEAVSVLREAEKRGLVVLFYAGDRVLVRDRRKETDMFIVSHEPVPEAVSDLERVVQTTFVHKALLVDPIGNVREWRTELETCLEGVAHITQSRPDVLEVLPKGSGKGDGFKRLLQHMNVERELTMAIGDGENDFEMIREAGLGVAVANAVPELLKVADKIICGNEEAAVAYAIRNFITDAF